MSSIDDSFLAIASLILERRARAVRLVNTKVIDLYWEIEKLLSLKTKAEVWGAKVLT